MPTRNGIALLEQMNQLVVPPAGLAIWGLGQMGVALKGGDQQLVYIDPCLSNVVAEKVPSMATQFARAFPPPIAPHEISNASYVLCSHEHLDHCDPLTLGPIAQASPGAVFVASSWAAPVLDEAEIAPQRRLAPTTEAPLTLGNLRVWSIPAAHYEVEHDPQRGYRWLSFLIEWNGVTFFHSGDTLIYPGYTDRLRSLPQADVAMVAANGRDAYRESFDVHGTLVPAEAAWLAGELGWDVLIGGHNDLYLWNTVGAGDLAEACRRLAPHQKLHTLQPGELYLYLR